jgi:hypothetical protein
LGGIMPLQPTSEIAIKVSAAGVVSFMVILLELLKIMAMFCF